MRRCLVFFLARDHFQQSGPARAGGTNQANRGARFDGETISGTAVTSLYRGLSRLFSEADSRSGRMGTR
jgi:hypothetical protein